MRTSPLAYLIAIYWAAFWLLNGLDKFFCKTDLGVFRWNGRDRTDQFGGYFEQLSLPEAAITPLLMATGVWEIAIALPFLMIFANRGKIRRVLENGGIPQPIYLGFVLSAVTFIGFSVFDVVAGDRAELLEHGTYIGVVAVSYIALIMDLQRQTMHTHMPAPREIG